MNGFSIKPCSFGPGGQTFQGVRPDLKLIHKMAKNATQCTRRVAPLAIPESRRLSLSPPVGVRQDVPDQRARFVSGAGTTYGAGLPPSKPGGHIAKLSWATSSPSK